VETLKNNSLRNGQRSERGYMQYRHSAGNKKGKAILYFDRISYSEQIQLWVKLMNSDKLNKDS
jgi:hypothetical protein